MFHYWKSKYWQYFTNVSYNEASYDLCLGSSTVRKKIIRTSGNTSNLKQHLRRKYPIFKKKILIKEEVVMNLV